MIWKISAKTENDGYRRAGRGDKYLIDRKNKYDKMILDLGLKGCVVLCVLTFYHIFLLSNIKIALNFYCIYALKSK